MTEPVNDGSPTDDIRFIVEYLYENDLLTDFARLQAGTGRRANEIIAAAICAALGVFALCSHTAWNWLGIIGVLIAAYLLWHQANLRHIMARHYIDAMEADTGSFGDRFRRVAISDDGVIVFARDGRSRYYPLDTLDRVQRDENMTVLIFGEEGVAIPHGSFMRGTPEELAAFLAKR